MEKHDKERKEPKKKNETSPCPKCEKFTLSVLKERLVWYCDQCQYDKTLSDVLWLEMITEGEEELKNDENKFIRNR